MQTVTNGVAKRIGMGFEIVDRYLLGEPVSKPDVVSAILADRSGDPAAQPFYRAFEAVGSRAADEAFIALRLILAGKGIEDSDVRRIRALTGVVRSTRTGDIVSLKSVLERNKSVLADLPASGDLSGDHLAILRGAAEAAYRAELA